MKISITLEAKSQLKSLDIFVQRRITSRLKKIAIGEEKPIKLKENLSAYFKLVDKKYRAIYVIKSNDLIVFKIGKRTSNFYMDFESKVS